MELLTPSLSARLLANGRKQADHCPVVKFFNPLGAATWLLTELGADGDTLFGLADLGLGRPELGYASLAEIAGLRLAAGIGIERDILFEAVYPLSVYAQAARMQNRFTERPEDLARALQAPGAKDTRLPP